MSNGKGSRPRNNFSQKFRDNYDSIFRKTAEKKAKKPRKISTESDER